MKTTFKLEQRNLHGTQVYGLENTNFNLVKKNEEGEFEPVQEMDQYLSASEMDESYGIWEDREVTKGMWLWKKTLRQEDGQIQADEVRDFPTFRNHQSTLRLGPQIGIDYMQMMDGASIRMENFQTGEASIEISWHEDEGYFGRPTGWKSPLSPLAQKDKKD